MSIIKGWCIPLGDNVSSGNIWNSVLWSWWSLRKLGGVWNVNGLLGKIAHRVRTEVTSVLWEVWGREMWFAEYTHWIYMPSALYSYCKAHTKGRGTWKGRVDKACEVPIFSMINTSFSCLQVENGMALFLHPQSPILIPCSLAYMYCNYFPLAFYTYLLHMLGKSLCSVLIKF